MVSTLIQTVGIPPRSLKCALQAVVISDKTKIFEYLIQNIQEKFSRSHSRAESQSLSIGQLGMLTSLAMTRFTYSLIHHITQGNDKSLYDRQNKTKLVRLQLGTTLLKEHMNKIMPAFYDSPKCDCGTERATIERYYV